MSPKNFDRIFKELDIECVPLTKHVNWKTYCCYLTAIEGVRKELCVKYSGEGNISPLDAHSFLWLHTYTDYSSNDTKFEKEYPVDFRQTEKYREAVSKARLGQGKYRKDMIDIWSGRCAVTDCAKTDILKASHAKPWGDIKTTADEAIDPFNGFLLSPDLDELFDKGYITFEDSGNIKISSKIKEKDYSKLGINKDMKLRFVNKKHMPYLQFHRENKYRI